MKLVGAEKISIGTMIEAGWADAYRKPVVLVINDKNIHDHGMLRTIASLHTTTLDDGIDVVASLVGTCS